MYLEAFIASAKVECGKFTSKAEYIMDFRSCARIWIRIDFGVLRA